ncbi:NADP-dependent oxidoreductase domain-containing protein [Umbelopsis sp. AD052]|nr:NADP-dependent oxidoreductase domain-containing protein [Umbelopsis sp. AD052]
MHVGEGYKDGLGECSKQTSFEILDHFASQGDNFIETANVFQEGKHEQWLGDWMMYRRNRDEMVIATKYSTAYKLHLQHKIQAKYGGNDLKSMRVSLEESLKNLQTTYIDLFYLHWWDYTLMHSLNDLVAAGKEIIPMCRAEGMGLVSSTALGSGRFYTEEGYKEREISNSGHRGRPQTEREKAVSKALQNVANAHGTILTSVALAYVRQKAPYVIPVVAGSTLDPLKDNIAALSLYMTKDEIRKIENAYKFDPGYPNTFLSGNLSLGGELFNATKPSDVFWTKRQGTFDWIEPEKPIEPIEQRK